MTLTFAGEKIVLIGASAGIGLATAKLAVQGGAEVVIAGRNKVRLRSAITDIGGASEGHSLDATNESELAAFFSRVGAFHHLCTFVPSATDKSTPARYTRFLDMDPDLFANVFRNRFWSQCYAARQGMPNLADSGSIVFVSNTNPRKVIPNYSAGCAAAGAIEALARILALELAPVRVNVIAPGFVATPGTGMIPQSRKQAWDALTQSQPVKRLAEPAEIAHGILFLMANRFATGTVLSIDGGYSLS
jgi:NAD(P)-dependent dehydrogenase (short-subunit alcohol dehydrogenase family)